MSNSDQSHESHADGIVEAGQKVPSYFYLLFFGLIAWGVIFMAYYLFSGWSSDAELKEKMAAHQATYNQTEMSAKAAPAAEPAANSVVDAAVLFANNCAGCHGEDGKGGFGSDLSSPTYKYGKDAETIKTSITQGRGGKMPAFGGQLTTVEIDALTEFSINL